MAVEKHVRFTYFGISSLLGNLDEIEEELLKLKIQELEGLENLSKETLENGVPWEKAKKEFGP
ncbi:hypothetical protein [Thermococcus barossii]|uniref:Uncharacterized protein n=1 Tax=Thermococcus barossii TaxID=54077 RepID=A0A2Z2MFM2_9EURY|nr:hypothetical protein [Thermococcus barossii]ASJ04716.1 hypothetical protein A3L01_04805 [Thermococcus barossii]